MALGEQLSGGLHAHAVVTHQHDGIGGVDVVKEVGPVSRGAWRPLCGRGPLACGAHIDEVVLALLSRMALYPWTSRRRTVGSSFGLSMAIPPMARRGGQDDAVGALGGGRSTRMVIPLVSTLKSPGASSESRPYSNRGDLKAWSPLPGASAMAALIAATKASVTVMVGGVGGVGDPQELVELARFKHLSHDIGPTNEFLVHVELGNGGPVAVVLDALANLGVGQDVHRLELDTERLQRAQGSGAEATLWHLLVPLHEQDDLVFADDVLDGAANV